VASLLPQAPAADADHLKAELHWLDTGHFALEEDGEKIGKLMRAFLARSVK
jgi:pimeloyl-ACP methyl ester carboxylesterase